MNPLAVSAENNRREDVETQKWTLRGTNNSREEIPVQIKLAFQCINRHSVFTQLNKNHFIKHNLTQKAPKVRASFCQFSSNATSNVSLSHARAMQHISRVAHLALAWEHRGGYWQKTQSSCKAQSNRKLHSCQKSLHPTISLFYLQLQPKKFPTWPKKFFLE